MTTRTHTTAKAVHTPTSQCSCWVEFGPWRKLSDGTPARSHSIVYCPTHAQAPAMLAGYRDATALLETLDDTLQHGPACRPCRPYFAGFVCTCHRAMIAHELDKARAILRAVEG